ncbi:MAG: hypothetical protein M0027_01915 [Candidatus Dormibacteraeota bacterium]|nr:hypothetical protein [Candidatus Dormibacteraeota bacterium]
MKKIRAFAAFWYDFVVGDDWRVACGVAGAIFLTWAASSASLPSWWIVPVAVAIVLPVTLWHALRAERQSGGSAPARGGPHFPA